MTGGTRVEASNYQINETVGTFIHHILVIAMVTSLSLSVVSFGERVFLGWEGRRWVLLALLTTIEAMVTRRSLGKLNMFDRRWLIMRLVEWVVLLVSLRAYFYILQGPAVLVADLQRWGFQFINYFTDLNFLVVAIFMFFTWAIADAFADDLLALEGDRQIVDRDTFRLSVQDRHIGRGRLISRSFSWGFVVLILTAITRADLGFFLADRPALQVGGANLLVYFLSAIALFSLTELAIKRALWKWEEIPIDTGVAKNWALGALAFLGLIFAVSAWLPTAYSISALNTLGAALSWLLSGIIYLLNLLWVLLLIPLLYLSRLGGVGQPSSEAPPPFRPPSPPPPVESNLSYGNPVLGLISAIVSMALWILFLALVYYSFSVYFNKHRHLLERLRGLPVLLWIGNLLESLRQFWFRNTRSIATLAKEAGELLRSRSENTKRYGRAFRIFRPGSLAPREQIQFYYLALLRQTRKSGFSRHSYQTPREYAQTLVDQMPAQRSDILGITQAFIEAKYSQNRISAGKARTIRQLWRRLLKALRNLERKRQSSDQSS